MLLAVSILVVLATSFFCSISEASLLSSRRHFAGGVGLEAARCAHEFQQVLDARLALFTLVLFEEVDEAAGMNDVIHLLLQVQSGDVMCHAFDHLHESANGVGRQGS